MLTFGISIKQPVMISLDLHVHSEFSNDGELPVSEIIRKCTDNEIGTLSITDHNSVRGTEEAVRLSSRAGIRYLPGVEIDCNYQGIDLHLLGYQIHWRNRDFIALEEESEKRIMDSVPQMIENLARTGIEIDAEEIYAKSGGKPPSAELFAEVLLDNPKYHSNEKLQPYMEGGARSDMPFINFYLDYFAQGKPAYVKIDHMSFLSAVELIRDHGGLPVVAHPGQNFKGKEEKVVELLELGAAGMEVFNNYHGPEQMEYFASVTTSRDALMTCGSDFHGKTKPLIELGSFRMSNPYLPYLTKSIQQMLEHTTTC